MKSQKQEFKAVDILKFVFCLFIIAIHTNLFLGLGNPYYYYFDKILLRVAVPFFFVASGFFLGKKLTHGRAANRSTNGEIIKKYIVRLLKPYLVFLTVNILQEIILQLYATHTIDICDIIRHIFFYPYGALWYIWASIIGVVCLYPFIIKNRIGLAVAVGAVLYVFALACNNYYYLFQGTSFGRIIESYLRIFISPRNGMLVGIFFISLGIKASELKIEELNKKMCLCALVGAYALYIIECVVLYTKDGLDDGSLLVFSGPLALILLLFALCSNPAIDNEKAMVLRNLSTGVYFIHRPILWCVARVIPTNEIVMFALTVIISVGICLAVYKSKIEPLYSLLK